MEIKKTIKLNINIKDGNVICSDTFTLSLILGTKGISGNHHVYGVEKRGTLFVVPLSSIKKRIEYLEERKQKIEESLEIMKQIVR
jgi:hypothetical protein